MQGRPTCCTRLDEAFKQAGADTPPVFLAFEGQYRAMAGHGALRVERPACDVVVPMRYHHDDRRDPVMLFVPAELNGVACEVNYDTGAGANVMSQEMADRIGAYIAPVEGIPVMGGGTGGLALRHRGLREAGGNNTP